MGDCTSCVSRLLLRLDHDVSLYGDYNRRSAMVRNLYLLDL